MTVADDFLTGLAASGLSLRGEDGKDGLKGDPGPKGDKGDRGDKGRDGSDGIDGKDGAKGDKGDKGAKGDTGKDGVGPDEKVKLSASDPKAGFLSDKLEAGRGIYLIQRDGEKGERFVIEAAHTGGAVIGVGGGSNGGGSGAVDSVNGQTGVVVVDASEVPFTPAGTIAATDVQAAIEEVAAEAGSSGLPIATPSVAVVDTTTYDNPIGPGKIATLVLSGGDGVAFAVALDGDAFPRWLMVGDAGDGLYLGDGTDNPYNGGVAIAFGGTLAGTHYLLLEGPSSNVQVGVTDANAGPVTGFSGAVELIGSSGQVIVSGDVGAPTKGGNVGDLFLRQDGANNNELIYRCTVAGTAGLATWVAVPIDQTAAEVPFTPAGTIAATDVQAAIEEVAAEASGLPAWWDVDSTPDAEKVTFEGRVEIAPAAAQALTNGLIVFRAPAGSADNDTDFLVFFDEFGSQMFTVTANGGFNVQEQPDGTDGFEFTAATGDVLGIGNFGVGSYVRMGAGGAFSVIRSGGDPNLRVLYIGDDDKLGFFDKASGGAPTPVAQQTAATLGGIYASLEAYGLLNAASGQPTVQTYTESNVTTDRAFNANATSIDELADVLGTLIADLRAQGVVA